MNFWDNFKEETLKLFRMACDYKCGSITEQDCKETWDELLTVSLSGELWRAAVNEIRKAYRGSQGDRWQTFLSDTQNISILTLVFIDAYVSDEIEAEKMTDRILRCDYDSIKSQMTRLYLTKAYGSVNNTNLDSYLTDYVITLTSALYKFILKIGKINVIRGTLTSFKRDLRDVLQGLEIWEYNSDSWYASSADNAYQSTDDQQATLNDASNDASNSTHILPKSLDIIEKLATVVAIYRTDEYLYKIIKAEFKMLEVVPNMTAEDRLSMSVNEALGYVDTYSKMLVGRVG